MGSCVGDPVPAFWTETSALARQTHPMGSAQALASLILPGPLSAPEQQYSLPGLAAGYSPA